MVPSELPKPDFSQCVVHGPFIEPPPPPDKRYPQNNFIYPDSTL